jgi:hypothetical protein
MAIYRSLISASRIWTLRLRLALIAGGALAKTLTLVWTVVLILVGRSLGVSQTLRSAWIALVGIWGRLMLVWRVAGVLRSILGGDAWRCRHSLAKLVCLLRLAVISRIWGMRACGGNLGRNLAFRSRREGLRLPSRMLSEIALGLLHSGS